MGEPVNAWVNVDPPLRPIITKGFEVLRNGEAESEGRGLREAGFEGYGLTKGSLPRKVV